MAKKQKPSAERYTVGRALSNTSYSPRTTRRPAPQNTSATPAAKSSGQRQQASQAPSASKGKAARKPGKDRSDKRFAWSRKKTIALVLFILLAPVLFIAGWDAKNVSDASKTMFGTGNLLEAVVPTSLSGSERGRVNVLVVGYSADDPGHAGANLTDSIMILSLDTKDKKGYMLSVPRDLYVQIPGSGKAKINEAYQRGEIDEFKEAGYAAGGMGLLEKTIHDSFDIQIDYYALVDYATVRDITTALDGITVTVASSDPRGLYDPNFLPKEGGPLRLSNGPQKLDGETALKLTRARGATYGSYGFAQSDFDRTKHQQQVLVGIKQGLTWKILLDPRENKDVLDAVAHNVKTDVKINEVLPLYRLFNRIPDNQLQSVNLRDFNGRNLLQGYTTPTGQSALIPAAGANDYSDIQALIQSLNH